MTDFGERVDLTANLASILRRYPFSTGLFREILQNSDDARATKQVFILDRREFGTKTLINEALAGIQGPAFLAYNDAVFSDADWEAIRTVSQSSKTADSEKIGKHGLGSRAYYHLTDNPQYLSGGHLVIFDPHRWAFEHGGWKQSLEEVASQYPDQIEPFNSLLHNTSRTDFPGTVVRLALRDASSESRISSKRVSSDEIHDLLIDFIKQELDIAMLFLSHLTSVEVKEIGVDGQEKILASATASSRSPQALQLSDPTMTFTLASRAITSPSQVPSSAVLDWNIARASFPREEFIDLLCDSLDANREWVAREVEREKLRSDVALAFPANSLHAMNGRLFTYLPLPLTTGFPCHIHGVFSLTDSRQNLRNPSETIMRETADALAVAWNRLLFDTLIPRTWLALLESIAAGHSSMSIYSCLPPLQDRNTSGDAMYWTSLLRNVVQLAHMRNARIWPLCTGSGGSSETLMYGSLKDVFVAGTQDEEQLSALADVGLNIVIASSSLRGVLLEACPSQDLSPRNAHPALVECSDDLSGLPQTQKDLIVEFLLGSRDLRELIDVPVFQLVSGETAALEAGHAGRQEVHVLLDESAAELFGQFDANAINLRDVPATASVLLVDNGSKYLNVRPLDSSQCVAYIKNAQTKFSSEQAAGSLGTINGWPWRLAETSSGGAWSWDRTVKWLAAFWGWVETCTFIRALRPHLKKLHLLPTTNGMVRSVEDQVFSYSYDVADAVRVALSGLGVNILDLRIPSKFFDRQTPKFGKSLSNASDLLAVLGPIALPDIEDTIANILREHLARCLMNVVRLDDSQKATLRGLPIHLVLTAGAPANARRLPTNHVLLCVLNPASIPLPLPSLSRTTFVHCTADERYLIEKLDYNAVAQPLTAERVLHLHVCHFIDQDPETRLTVLTYLIDNKSLLTTSLNEQLRSSSIISVDGGTRLLPPKDVVDPNSSIASIVPPWDTSAIFEDNGINTRITSALASLRLLRHDLDVEYVEARIAHIAGFPAQSNEGLELARRLLSVMDETWFDCSNVRYDHDIAWIPTGNGFRRPRDCRDAKDSVLCDRVMPMLDMQPPTALQSTFLRKMLGWDGPMPLDTIIAQYRIILREPQSSSRSEYLDVLTSELGRRFTEVITSVQLDDIVSFASQVPWVLISTGELQLPAFAVFTLPERLRGFGQISIELARRPGVKEFLMHMGCTLSPTNNAIIDQLRRLQLAQNSDPPQQVIQDSVQLLRALDIPSLTALQRENLLAPGSDCRLHEIHGLYYNDLGSRALQLESPDGRIQVNQIIPRDLCDALHISSLGSFHLQPLELDTECMREDLSTRIQNVLRSYDIDQAFNEFLANAADAGARKFSIMLDHGDDRRVDPSEVLCQNMVQFCQGPAVIAHNDAEFTMDDIRGICRIGRGGKEDKEGTVGRFGLGALSFYHFSEVAMILSGSYILLLDPSGSYLPNDSGRNSYVVPLDKMRSLYPGHINLFQNVFGFQVEHTHYSGTIIRLALRTKSQASKSALSKRSISTHDVRDMLDRYYSIAARSLFFIRVQSITALEKKPGASKLIQKWTIIGQREDVQSNENDNLTLFNLSTDHSFSFSRLSRQSRWLVITKHISPEQFPDGLRTVINRHRLKQLSIALAARISPKNVPRDDPASHFHFFSSLPLPISTSLSTHVHASFILADDRRNIRWDGDGTLTTDSECNHWLLSTALPSLYLRVIEMLNERFTEASTPWPGDMHSCPDPISKALIDAFYSENNLSGSPRRVFRNIRGHLLDPPTAVIRDHGMPQAVKDILHQLRPDAIVELPVAVRSRVLNVPSIQHTSPQYVRDAIASSPKNFLAACANGVMPLHEVVQGVIRYMLIDHPKLSVPNANLHGLPLLVLADGTMADIQAEGVKGDQIYGGSWGRAQPWPLFPATCFLDPRMDQQLFFGRGWNVSLWDDSTTVIALLRKKIPERAQCKVSETERRWIITFWRFFDSALEKKKLLDALRSFPLIPTKDEQVFVSLTTATALPAILHPNWKTSRLDFLRFVHPLQKIGVLIIDVNLEPKLDHRPAVERLPQIVQGELAIAEFTFTRVLQTLNHLNKGGQIGMKFRSLSDDEHSLLANWLRDFPTYASPLKTLKSFKKGSDFANVFRHLLIWPAFHGSEPPNFVSLSAGHVRLLPEHAKPARNIVPFLLADPTLHFIEYSKDIVRLQILQPLSPIQFLRQLKFPSPFPLHMLKAYKTLIDAIIGMGIQHGSSNVPLQIPNGDLEPINVCSLYKSSVREFDAVFAHKPGKVFVHPQLRSYEQRLLVFGLRDKLTFETFKECVTAIHQDFDKDDPGDHGRCWVIYQWYATRLPLSVPNANLWRQLDAYSFLPTRRSRRLGVATSFDEAAFAKPLPLIVYPNNILRDEYSAVAWTQRALFQEAPNKMLFMADEFVGVPAVEEVVDHLRVLVTQIAPQYPRDAGLLSDLRATYQYLQQHHGEAKKFLLPHQNEALFLNVDIPEIQSWVFLPASQIMFNVLDEDEGDDESDLEVRAFLRPYRDLLLASGANEIKIPLAPTIPLSSAEAYLSSFRASIAEQRRSKALTDVVFRVAGAPVTGGDNELWAHRALLATASEYFRSLFCGQSGFAESGPASVVNPIVINLEDELELRCAGLVLDHIYTGKFEEVQDRDCLLELMHLAHRWELAGAQAKAEALLVRKITPGAYRELRKHAERINATKLLEKIQEFERDNMPVLKSL